MKEWLLNLQEAVKKVVGSLEVYDVIDPLNLAFFVIFVVLVVICFNFTAKFDSAQSNQMNENIMFSIALIAMMQWLLYEERSFHNSYSRIGTVVVFIEAWASLQCWNYIKGCLHTKKPAKQEKP